MKFIGIFLFSKVCLATLIINSILVVVQLSGRITPTNRPDSRTTGYEPDMRYDPIRDIDDRRASVRKSKPQ